MSEVDLTLQLDQAIDAMMAAGGQRPSSVDERIAELLDIAVELRELPHAEFREQLRKEIMGEAIQSAVEPAHSKKTDPVREGFRTITPYLVVSDVQAEAAFLQQAFGAQGHIYGLGSQGGFHAEYQIGESRIMVGGGGEGSAWKGEAFPGSLHLYVEDVDAVYERALQAGATSLYAPMDQPYGDRDCGIRDTGGNEWFVGSRLGGAQAEGAQNLMPSLHPIGAPKMIDFLKQAFGAEEIAVHRSPDEVVRHASMRVGTSIIEMGEAHGQWQPRPSVFMMYVDDVDTWFARAAKAEGVVVKDPPKLQPHGARVGSIKDPFDNVWYIASQQQAIEEQSSQAERKPMGAPKLFRIALQVADLEQATAFYAKLLDDPGIPIPRGSRHYFNCGPVILALVDVAKGAGEKPQPTPDYIYFAVNNLDEYFKRAQALNCLATDRYHDQNAGEVLKRPWGEVSFYCEDPWGNGLCFVDETTLFTGK